MQLDHRLQGAAGALAIALALGACAPKQKVSLDCVPEEVTVYVDGRALEETPQEIELRADRPHKIFVKAPGHEPQLIVLEPEVDERGRQSLEPAEVCVDIVPVGLDRELTLEVDEEPAPANH
jgi:hypothetical protein